MDSFFFFFFKSVRDRKNQNKTKKTINIKNNRKRKLLQSVIEQPSVRLMRCKKKKKKNLPVFGVSDEWPSL